MKSILLAIVMFVASLLIGGCIPPPPGLNYHPSRYRTTSGHTYHRPTPTYRRPVYRRPTPTYRRPVYRRPVYRRPVYRR